MENYLKFNFCSDHVCLTDTNVYFKLREICPDTKARENFDVFIAEEYFPILLKIMQAGANLSELLDFNAFGGNFADAIVKSQEKLGLMSDDETLFKKYTSWILWPTKHQELIKIWQDDTDLQSNFSSADDFISDQSEEELWELYEMWEISHGKKIDLTSSSLQDFCSGGWALDGSYIEESHRFVGFNNITKIKIELFNGSQNVPMTAKKLMDFLLSKYENDAEAFGVLEPKALADRGVLRDNHQEELLAKKKSRLIKIFGVVIIGLAYLVWRGFR